MFDGQDHKSQLTVTDETISQEEKHFILCIFVTRRYKGRSG